ncbi:flagellar export protein FliJ [Arthrobacter sp. GMC3]|uniref:flagellar export protein FliJ n=1 Tax=Arthrobacter sp. GMC3 TaxID=2058894 RepID=UPI000CE55E1F|nr:flagellar export protein FliJ [Arthrobacter sp. GMC3]
MTKAFRLGGLLRYRRLQEDQASANLARANASRRTHAQRMAAVRGELSEGDADVSSVIALKAAAAARATSRSLLLELQTLGAVIDADAQSAQAALVAAKMAASSLEKLADQHEKDSVEAQLLDEQKYLDELALTRKVGKL